MILDLLCDFLSALGQYRHSHVDRSKGKRLKRRRRKKDKEAGNSAAESVPPVPALVHYVTIGFNSTIQSLQRLASTNSNVLQMSCKEEELNPPKKVAAVFVCTSTLPALLTSSIPTLVAAASARHPSHPPIRLISLPREAEKRLAGALFQPRVGFVGLLQDAPGGKALIDMVMDKTTAVDVPWARADAQAKYRPVSIMTTSPLAEQSEEGVDR